MTGKKLRRYRGWIALVVLLAVGGSAFGFYLKNKTPKSTTTYQTEAATKGTLAVTVSGSGNLAIRESVDCYPKTSGTVSEVLVEEGDKVSAGDVLYKLDPEEAEAATTKAYAGYLSAKDAVQRATVSLLRARNNLAELEDTYADQRSHPATGATQQKVTKTDIAEAKADVASARTSLYSAKANRSSASQDYSDAQDAEDELVVTASVDGTVYSLDIEEGDSVSPRSGGSSGSSTGGSSAGGSSMSGSSSSSGSGTSSSPLSLIEDGALCVQLTVNEVDLPSLKLGQRADITVDAFEDLTLTGKVIEIAKTGTSSSGVVTFEVWLSIDVPDARLRESMTAAGTIVTQVVDDAVMVASGAVDSDTQGDYVMVMKSGATTPTRVDVTTGVTNDTSTQILSGLAEGDLVVTSSSDSSTSGSSGSGSGGTGNDRRGGFMMGGPGGGF